MKVGVVVFPGSNCDRDMYHVLSDVFHLDTQYFWHEKGLPKNIDAVVLPGGFSYGDRLGLESLQHILQLSKMFKRWQKKEFQF